MDDPHALLGSTDLAVDLQWARTDPFIPLSKEGSVLFKPDSSRGKDRREAGRAKNGASPGFPTI